MKILMATMGLDIGGAETHIVELSKALKAQGHDIVIASAGGVYVPELAQWGIRHVVVPMNRRSIPDLFHARKLLKAFIQEERPHVMHAHARIPAFLCGTLYKSLGVPFVTTAHGVFRATGMLRFLTNWGQWVMAVSEDIKTYLIREYQYPSHRISVTINGIDSEKFSPKQTGDAIRHEFQLPENAPILVSVTRMDQEPSQIVRQLIELAPTLCQEIPDLRMLLVGGGDALASLQALAEEANATLGRRAVILPGARTDVHAFLAVGHLFVGISRAVLEAMSGGKLVILAGNVGYQGRFTPESLEIATQTNFCCRGLPLSTPDRLKADILETFALPDAEKRALETYARELILEHYSVKRMADDCLNMYQQVLSSKV